MHLEFLLIVVDFEKHGSFMFQACLVKLLQRFDLMRTSIDGDYTQITENVLVAFAYAYMTGVKLLPKETTLVKELLLKNMMHIVNCINYRIIDPILCPFYSKLLRTGLEVILKQALVSFHDCSEFRQCTTMIPTCALDCQMNEINLLI